jgi:hypothetical protein
MYAMSPLATKAWAATPSDFTSDWYACVTAACMGVAAPLSPITHSRSGDRGEVAVVACVRVTGAVVATWVPDGVKVKRVVSVLGQCVQPGPE